MKITETALPGVLILEPRRFGDDRGWFMESWNRETLRGHGIEIDFVQDNHSYSAPKGTVRALHYQSPPHAQAKLVRVARGTVRDVAVDARRGSPTYGRHVAVDLSAENGRQLFVPAGFLHGFATLTPDVDLLYKCSDIYAPDCDGAVAWDDPDLGIDWGIDPVTATLSNKDRAAPQFADWTSPFTV
ncbi:dTDP-6-deoxy-D-glucose-3,5-epimerase [Oceanicola granulosus HTCC2516]|uniref:dTDP-4-dehydrorhamnose 3,5-epimerase n=1 Tax=Oceanicola granulosus (strain ATCC BAA-861 / DSM 15982 / KCTC 12143 / HTCC2516) TaxID=314256 RepID=Q2CHB4_OCEGH|nr:dTDP-4-dehydrorhamnose 3,5-epimerase [Oceanicola granulosus]EAR52125.1 dTDP-6-deoxy-D-glucose-3,5-epimerase [Oceanicola granulosus HTCC2516]